MVPVFKHCGLAQVWSLWEGRKEGKEGKEGKGKEGGKGKKGKREKGSACSNVDMVPYRSVGHTPTYHRHSASGEMKAQHLALGVIEGRGLDSSNADCKEFILILPIGSRQVLHSNNFA